MNRVAVFDSRRCERTRPVGGDGTRRGGRREDLDASGYDPGRHVPEDYDALTIAMRSAYGLPQTKIACREFPMGRGMFC